MRLIAAIIIGLTVNAGLSRAEGEINQVLAENPPVSIPASIPRSESSAEIPPLLSVPAEPAIRSSNHRKSCRSCANDYNPNLAYLPANNPDCRGGQCGSGCKPPERMWANADFFAGFGSDIRDVKHHVIYGVKLGLGGWLTDDHSLGLDGSFFNAHDPYRDIFLGRFGPTLIDSPVTLTTGDVNLRSELFAHGRFRVDGLAGYRYLALNEQLLENTPVASNFWRTTNSVNLGQVGAVGMYRFGPYTGELLVKLGFGQNEQNFSLNGVRTPANEFAFVPEVGFRVAYGMGEGLRTVLGYNLIYLNSALRPDRRDPPNYLLQGLTLGLEYRF